MGLKEAYNRIAQDWVRDHDKDDWWKPMIAKFESLLPAGGKIHDIGCGGGNQAVLMASHGYEVTGSDQSEQMIEEAKKRKTSARFYVRAMRQAPDEQFDGLLFSASLLHIPHHEILAILKTHLATLKSGGIICLSVKEQRVGEASEEIKTENDYGYEYQRFFAYFTEEELRDYADQLNLEVIDFSKLLKGHTVWMSLIARKK